MNKSDFISYLKDTCSMLLIMGVVMVCVWLAVYAVLVYAGVPKL